MDRNDYYGGESSSLNLNQVNCIYFTVFLIKNIIMLLFGIELFSIMVSSYGSDSKAMTHLLNNWVQAEITMLT